jgi:hypothetical protein
VTRTLTTRNPSAPIHAGKKAHPEKDDLPCARAFAIFPERADVTGAPDGHILRPIPCDPFNFSGCVERAKTAQIPDRSETSRPRNGLRRAGHSQNARPARKNDPPSGSAAIFGKRGN